MLLNLMQNTKSLDNQMRHLVYLIENAIFNLPVDQEQMVWLIDFTGWTLSASVPVKSARETINILQNHYPERLAVAFLYNPPRIFEAFWKVWFLLLIDQVCYIPSLHLLLFNSSIPYVMMHCSSLVIVNYYALYLMFPYPETLKFH